MEKYVLIKFEYNYGDEFYVYSIEVRKESEVNKTLDKIKNKFKPISIRFGTNEELKFESIEEITRGMAITEITESFYNEFLKVMGSNYYGTINLDDILENIKDE